MRGDEARVVAAFCDWLTERGWTVDTEVAFIDVAARRGSERLYAEVKGRTSSPGLDVDTLYGQRRMPEHEDDSARFGVVVPAEAVPVALRVPVRTRELLRIDVYAVTADGSVYLVTREDRGGRGSLR